MNNLLFTCLIIALLYYFFYYLPPKKSITNPPLTKLTLSQFTQTEPTLINSTELEELKKKCQELETELETSRKDYQQKIKAKESQITSLQSEVRDLASRPLKPTNSKSTQTDELTNTLDNLIKDIQDLNNSLN